MFTECPSCSTVFRVSSEQLKIAAGKVRCGRCNNVFNALDSLTEEVPSNLSAMDSKVEEMAEAGEVSEQTSAKPAASKAAPAPVPESEVSALDDIEIPGMDDFDVAEAAPEPEESVDLSDTVMMDLDPSADVSDEPLPRAERAQQEAEDSFFPSAVTMQENTHFNALDDDIVMKTDGDSEHDLHRGEQARDSLLNAIDDDPLEAVHMGSSKSAESYVLEELSSPKLGGRFGWVSTIGWSVLIILLTVVLVGQFMYFKKEELVKNAWMKQPLELMCQVVSYVHECVVPEPKDIGEIELVKRAVGTHPNRKGALLITAIIKNRAEFTQAFPGLELSFSDINRKIIARSVFSPPEYLSKSVDIVAGMNTMIPYRLKIEIEDPGEDAVNFEIKFK